MTNEPHEIVRYLEDGEESFPCWVGHGDDIEACRRPSTMKVYGLPFCEVHGEEARDGALEEMHQDADEFFTRFTTSHVPELPNPVLLAAVSRWDLTVPEGLEYSSRGTDELLLAAFPFREDRLIPETAGEIADPIPGQEPPYDALRRLAPPPLRDARAHAPRLLFRASLRRGVLGATAGEHRRPMRLRRGPQPWRATGGSRAGTPGERRERPQGRRAPREVVTYRPGRGILRGVPAFPLLCGMGV